MIDVDNLGLQQGAFQLAGISLHVPRGKYALLMGKTGCGKTTILEAIAGLRPIESGRGSCSTNAMSPPAQPAERNVGYVPQDGALFATMSVRDNLGFALSIRNKPATAIKERVEQLADWLQVTHLLERHAVGLSGGETQRIAGSRPGSLANHPPILLMDEPLSSLDEETLAKPHDRAVARRFASARRGHTVLHVTHSRHEADAAC